MIRNPNRFIYPLRKCICERGLLLYLTMLLFVLCLEFVVFIHVSLVALDKQPCLFIPFFQ